LAPGNEALPVWMGALLWFFIVELIDVVIVVLEAADRPMSLYELADECKPYMDRFVSYFEVKQVCMSLWLKQRIELKGSDPLSFTRNAA
jgi:hypothetical protein